MSIHDQAAMERLRRKHRLDPHLLRRLRVAFYKHQHPAKTALQELPAPMAEAWAKEILFHPLTEQARYDSKIDGASKLIFQTDGGHLIETVILRIATGRTSLCVSSQAGCAAACVFCATGKLGLARNLTAAEILDQVVQANQSLRAEGRKVRNLVFMGMGEPFHNEAHLYEALEGLRSPHGFNFDEGRLLVSTVGVPEAMVRCSRKFPKISLALSLHSARQEVREKIVPLARRHSLDDLRQALQEVTALRQQPVMIEYTLLKGVNDQPEDVEALIGYLGNLSVHINLIPYNPIPAAPELTGTEKPEREAIAKTLKARGFKVTLRYSLGLDIAAACGTLAASKKTANSVTGVAFPGS